MMIHFFFLLNSELPEVSAFIQRSPDSARQAGLVCRLHSERTEEIEDMT